MLEAVLVVFAVAVVVVVAKKFGNSRRKDRDATPNPSNPQYPPRQER